MNLLRRYYGSLILFVVSAAGFFLIFRGRSFVKIADLLFAAAGLLVFINNSARKRFIGFISSHKRYFHWFVALLLFIIVAQGISYFNRGIVPNVAIFVNYARVMFNCGLFLLVAFLICENSRLLTYVSVAVFVAPV